MARRLHTLLLGHLGMHDLALGGGVERGAAVVAVLEREVVLEGHDVGETGFAQYGFDLRERIWAHYELALFEHYRQDRLTQAELPFDDPSF